MKQRILLLLFIASVCNAHAQDSSTFKLKDYKYRTPGYKALQLSLNSGGSLTSVKFPNVKSQSSYFELSPSEIQYFKIVSTDRKQSTHNLGITPYYTINKNIDNDVKSTSRNLQSGFSWNFNYRYFNSSNRFLEWGNDLFNSFSQLKQTRANYETNNNRNNFRNNFFIGIGKGRIENVQDAQMALFIINDLQKNGLTNGITDGATVNDLAKLLTNLNNRRIFDYRRRRIFELTQIESFLKEKGITNGSDIRHFTIINDNWTFAFNPYRRSGTSWYGRLQVNGRYDYNFDKTNNVITYSSERRDYAVELGPQIGIEKYIPVNLKWQKNMGASLTGLWTKGRIRSESAYNGNVTYFKDSSSFIRSGVNLFYGLGYFPNNRTLVNADINLQVSRDWGKDQHIVEAYTRIRPSLNLSTDYFLGYRTRLQASINFIYDRQYAKENHLAEGRVIDKFFSLGLEHTIF